MPDYEEIAAGLAAPADEPNQREFFAVDHPKYQGLAAAKGYEQDNGQRLQSLRYSHEAMIDVIIADPEMFSRSVPWISRIIGSDAFQAALAKRREELSDPFLVATIEERFRGLAYQSLEIITEKLESSKNVDLALKGLDISAKVLGFGARGGGNNTQNTQFIIQLPPKSVNSTEWASQHGPMKLAGE